MAVILAACCGAPAGAEPSATEPSAGATGPILTEAELEELREALLDTWPEDAAPVFDPALDEVARAVAGDLAAGKVGLEPGRAFTTVQTHLWEQGLFDPRPNVASVVFEGGQAAFTLPSQLQQLPEHHRYSHLGLGLAEADGSRCAVVVLVQRQLTITSAPDWTPRSQQTLTFVPRMGLRDLRADLLGPGGTVTSLPLEQDGDARTARFKMPARPGVYRLEVLAEDGGGPTLAAMGVATVPGKTRAPPDPEAYLARWIEAERARHDLPTLRRHAPLDEVARTHSERMRDGQAFGHGLGTGTPEQRIREAGIPFSVALENVGRASTLDWVHTLVMASPSHRASVLHPRLSHVGIGVVSAEPLAWFVTEEFIRLLEPVDLEQAREQAARAVAEVRQASGLPALDDKRALDRLADRWCAELGGAGATEIDRKQIRALTEDVRFHLDDAERVVADLLVVDDVAALSWFPALTDPGFDQVGLGLYQPPEGGRITLLLILVARSTGD